MDLWIMVGKERDLCGVFTDGFCVGDEYFLDGDGCVDDSLGWRTVGLGGGSVSFCRRRTR